MRRFAVSLFFACAVASAAEPHRSTGFLPTANGRASAAYDAKARKLVQLLEHPYRYPSQGVESRNFLFDAYPGVRVGNQGAWLTSIAPSVIEYVKGTNVVHVARAWNGLTIDEYDVAPASLGENALVTLLKITRTSGSGAVDAYQIQNYHLGAGSPLPSASGEGMAYAPSRDAYYEWGPSGVAMGHASIPASSHHGASPNNPYFRLLSGANLADDAGPGSNYDDAVCGFQQSLGDLAVNQSAWAGWFDVLALDNDAQPAVDRVRKWINGRAPDAILKDEVDAWSKWITPAPMSASAREADLAAMQQVMLRMGQVSEPGKSDGQILASVAPGKWNIAWVRDMQYATVALARTGHAAEAKRAIAFELGADSGRYAMYVGAPYQISVVRYLGSGVEETDTNQDGPNIEFDGFGSFLWALDAYVKSSNDTASLMTWWPTVSSKVADVLVQLQDPMSGLVAPDSSIWEVHWNGKQQRFAYTTITAAAGLCAASRLAKLAGDAAGEKKYLDAGKKARDGLFAQLRAPDGSVASSLEQLTKGAGYLDAAAIEAVTLGLVRPDGRTAHATVAAIESALVPPSGRGFKRNQNGGWYDEQEWVFVDLRVARANDLLGGPSALAWNVDQGTENFGVLSELHDALTADYAGEAPMVGFGAGAYLLALWDRGAPGVPACGDYASEPSIAPPDAGSGADADVVTSSDAASPEGGATSPSGGASSGCSCNQTTTAPSPLFALVLVFLLRRRRS